MLFSLSCFVLLGPSCVKFFVKSIDLILLLDNHVIYLNFNSISPLFQELCRLFLRQLIDRLDNSVHLRVAIKYKKQIKLHSLDTHWVKAQNHVTSSSQRVKESESWIFIFYRFTYFFCLIRLSRIFSKLSTSADGLCFIVLDSSKYCLSYCKCIACFLRSFCICEIASL